MKNHDYSIEEIKNILFHLNYRWKLHSLCFWKGGPSPFTSESLYEGFEDFLSLTTYRSLVDLLRNEAGGRKLFFNFIEHFLQREMMPYEAELRTWMKGAAAHVKGQKIYLREIIPFCQKGSSREDRLILEKETRALCRFLRPFAISFWEVLLETLKDSLGFDDYLGYCKKKKDLNYQDYQDMIENVLLGTENLYFEAMGHWIKQRFGVGFGQVTRFDAINLLSLGQFDHLLPSGALGKLMNFLSSWGLDLDNQSSITIDVEDSAEKSPQAMCFVLQVPDEVYVLMKPQGGWLDLESLGHELGHALFAANISSELPFVDREISMGNALNEAFAFLVQNVTMSVPFMVEQLGVDEKIAGMLYQYKVLRDLSVFRRYAAKFLAEVEMFRTGDLSSGQKYAELLVRHTGFSYQPEACLFDLVPEFYSLDYVMAWICEAAMEQRLNKEFGERWMFSKGARDLIKAWWAEGYKNEVNGFMVSNGLGNLSPEHILNRWERIHSWDYTWDA